MEKVNRAWASAIERFLNRLGTSIFDLTTLRRISNAFAAYFMCIIVVAFEHRGYMPTPMNCPDGFIFKCYPAGDPNNYSFFSVQREEESFEVRMGVNARRQQYDGLGLNLDIAVISPNSIDQQGGVDSGSDLLTFVECKNLRGFAELLAQLEGMTYELQRERLYRDSLDIYAVPSCLFLSQPGYSTLNRFDRRFQTARKSMRVVEEIHPGSPTIRAFIQSWF